MAKAAFFPQISLTGSFVASSTALTSFLQGLWPEAQQRGISRDTFDAAIRGLEPDLSLPDLIIPGRTQKPPGQPKRIWSRQKFPAQSPLWAQAEP